MSAQLGNVDWGPVERVVKMAKTHETNAGVDHPGLHRVLNFAEATAFLGLSKATLERLVAEKCGPPMVRLSTRRCGFRLGDLMRCIDARVERANTSGKES